MQGRILDLAGSTDLSQLVVIFRKCVLVVGNDTGPLHMAVSAGTPVIALVGGGHYGRFFPYPPSLVTPGARPIEIIHRMDCFGCNWRCIFDVPAGDPYPCVAGIPVEEVFYKARSILMKSI